MKNFKKKSFFRCVCAVVLCAAFVFCSGCSVAEKLINRKPAQTAPPTVTVMFPEGSTVTEIAALLEKNSVCSAADFIAQADNATLLETYGISIPNPDDRAFLLEGYIFPDTYEFYVNEGAEKAIVRFLKNTKAKLNAEVVSRSAELGYSVDEILTVASVIQEETGNPEYMGKVSSVLHNRLQSSHLPKLECDATVFYLRESVKEYVDAERYEELKELYNTYNFKGLPAGPICNPGMEAINAALYPEETDYYFFASDSEGVYYFGETYEDHLEYCAEAGI